jgi:hypothetical protein
VTRKGKRKRQAGELFAETIHHQFDILGAHVSYHHQEFVASQPPHMSLARVARFNVSPNVRSTASPAAWPKVSQPQLEAKAEHFFDLAHGQSPGWHSVAPVTPIGETACLL